MLCAPKSPTSRTPIPQDRSPTPVYRHQVNLLTDSLGSVHPHFLLQRLPCFRKKQTWKFVATSLREACALETNHVPPFFAREAPLAYFHLCTAVSSQRYVLQFTTSRQPAGSRGRQARRESTDRRSEADFYPESYIHGTPPPPFSLLSRASLTLLFFGTHRFRVDALTDILTISPCGKLARDRRGGRSCRGRENHSGGGSSRGSGRESNRGE